MEDFSSPLNRDDHATGPSGSRQVMSPTRGLRLAGEANGPDYGSTEARQGMMGPQLPNGVVTTGASNPSGGAEQRTGATGYSEDAGLPVEATGSGFPSTGLPAAANDGAFATPTGNGTRDTFATLDPVRGSSEGVGAEQHGTTTPAAPAAQEAATTSSMPSLPLEPQSTSTMREPTIMRPTDLPPMTPASMSRTQVTEHTRQTDGGPEVRVQTMVREQVVQGTSGYNTGPATQTNLWSRVGKFFHRRVAEPMRGQAQRASSSTDAMVFGRRSETTSVGASPKAALFPPRVAQAMSEWASRPSLINPQA